jgi:general secretion pathway protein K
MKRTGQRGAALLIAMLTVALVATFAAASLWQQWRNIEVETAERARVQSGWILTGALDWARLLLREDAMGSGAGVDHLGEPWAVPLEEARLSSFLAADTNNTSSAAGGEVMDAFLSGQIVDLQSLMNVNNLVTVSGSRSEPDYEAFGRLFDLLGLPQTELDKLAENLRFAIAAGQVSPSPAAAPLIPQHVAELVWLGVSPQTVAAIEPYVTLLPRTSVNTRPLVNVNTAPAEVIAAATGIDLSDAQRIVQVRNASPFRTVAQVQSQLQGTPAVIQRLTNELSVNSSFFEVRARLRLDKLVVEERSVVWRNGLNVTVMQRERGAPDPTAVSRIATSQR